jgi:hypothetical protein
VVRPYLLVGTGFVHLASRSSGLVSSHGAADPPSPLFASTALALRVAVGMDLRVADGWAFRYSFSETVRGNAISARLSPPAERNLANFQNLFGLIKSFPTEPRAPTRSPLGRITGPAG